MTLNKPLNHSLLDTGITTPTCRTAERINLHGVFKVLRSQWALKSFYHCLYISKLINCCCEKDLLSRFSDLHMQCLHGYIRDWQAVRKVREKHERKMSPSSQPPDTKLSDDHPAIIIIREPAGQRGKSPGQAVRSSVRIYLDQLQNLPGTWYFSHLNGENIPSFPIWLGFCKFQMKQYMPRGCAVWVSLPVT